MAPTYRRFRHFERNTALYYTILVTHFQQETVKEDVCGEVVLISSYPTRLRGTLIDIAGKVARDAERTILKVTEATWRRIRLPELWTRAAAPPRFAWT